MGLHLQGSTGGGASLTSYVSQVAALSDYPTVFPSTNEVSVVVYSGSAGTARPVADLVVWQGFPAQPTNMADGDLWLSDLGGTVLTGSGAPTNGDGANGDFWIRTSNSTIYGPKAAGVWPSGVSLVGPTGPSGGLNPTASKTANYTAAANDFVRCDASGGAFTVTLPTPTAGIQVGVKKTDSSANAVTVATTSGTIDGSSTRTVSVQYGAQVYVADGTNWQRVTVPQVTAIAATGTPSAATYLRGDGSWATPAGGGGGTTYDRAALLGPTGTVRASLDRTAVTMGSVANTSGTLYVGLTYCLTGDAFTAVNMRVGPTTAISGGTHSWGVIADINRVVLAVSADDTTATTAINTVKSWTLASGPYVIPSNGWYYLGFMQAATALSSLGATAMNAAAPAIPPITWGTSNTAATTPVSVGATLSTVTPVTNIVPYIWTT